MNQRSLQNVNDVEQCYNKLVRVDLQLIVQRAEQN